MRRWLVLTARLGQGAPGAAAPSSAPPHFLARVGRRSRGELSKMAYNEEVVSNLSRLDEQDKKLLNALQRDFPVDERPFARLAERVNLSEQEVLRRVARYKQERIVRQIGAIFDTRSLGYESSLVAKIGRASCRERVSFGV